MPNELNDLIDTAIYKEIASQAVYVAAQRQTDDPGAVAMMKELAEDEIRHAEILQQLRDSGWRDQKFHVEEIHDLKITEYLTGSSRVEGASLQDTLVFAMKREQQSVEFYSRMKSILRSEEAKLLCDRLIQQELKHKHRLETLYDDLYYDED